MEKRKKIILTVLAGICLLGIFGACYDGWREMWFNLDKTCIIFFIKRAACE